MAELSNPLTPSIEAENPKNKDLAQGFCWPNNCQLCHHIGVNCDEARAQRTNRARVVRCSKKMARATLAESVIPRRVSPAKAIRIKAVTSMGGKKGNKSFKYSAAVLAEITEVARYDSMVRQEAIEASNFLVQFSRAL